MQMLYGYDVAADLQPGCRYDEVVRALGGAGETVDRARARSAAALDRASPPACPTSSTSSPTPSDVYPGRRNLG